MFIFYIAHLYIGIRYAYLYKSKIRKVVLKRSRRNTFKDRCEVCRINYRLCFCDQINHYQGIIHSDIKISIIMHYTERWLTSNTAYFTSVIHPHCQIIERGNIDKKVDATPFTHDDIDYIYLFPTQDSKPLKSFKKSSRPIHLVVPDGSWSKAKRIHKREDAFKSMNKYHLEDVGESRYQLRKSPGENFLCTYEAIAHALSDLGETQTKELMLSFFDIFVDRVLKSRRGDFSKSSR